MADTFSFTFMGDQIKSVFDPELAPVVLGGSRVPGGMGNDHITLE